MPIYIQIYFFIYIIFCLWCGYQDIRTRHRKWILGDIILETGSVVVALAYWLPRVRDSIEPFALLLFAGGFVWNLIEAIIGFRKLYFDKSLPSYQNIPHSIAGMLIGAIAYAPLFYWGFLYAILNQTANIP